MKRHFIIQENEDSGQLGFIEKGAPVEFDPLSGLGTAHDCLEHFSNGDGSIDDEAMALGCGLWVRGMGGYSFGWNNVEQAMASEFGYMLWPLFMTGDYPVRPKKSNLELEPLVYQTTEAIKSAVYDEKDNDDIIDEVVLDKFIEDCGYWLQVGFTKAKRKYKNCGTAAYLFSQIEKLVDDTLKGAYEGQEFIISFCISKGTASIEEHTNEDFYY